jgi:putative ABC transport system permease protein
VRFLTIIVRNLRQRPLRTLITILGVAAAVGGFSILDGLGRGVEEAWNSSLVKQGTHLLAYRKGVRDLLTGTINQRIADEVRNVPGVQAVSTELLDVITLENGTSILVRGWEVDSTLWRETSLIVGRLPVKGALREVVVGETLAESMEIKPGDEITPFGAVLKVVGVARTDNVLSNNSVYMPLVGLQDMLDRGRKITGLHIRVEQGHNESELEATRNKLGQLFPHILFVIAQKAAQENEQYRFWRGMGWAASLVGLVMGLFIVFNTMLVSVLERTREIGILEAVGWSRFRILMLVLLESVVLCSAGGLAGMVLGYLGLKLLILHPKLYGFLMVSPSIVALGQQFVAIILLGIGGGFLPAWRALNLKPMDALKDN